MQPKVSMVMPCYNKVEWIGGMLNSVIDQKWDNIEVILVNDGSTDGTRNVISEYEPKLKKRGYDVIIIDQENIGVAGAVRNGLLKITGEFVCQVDADDELDPEYVNAMATWLSEHPDDMVVACKVDRFQWCKDIISGRKRDVDISLIPTKPLERFLLNRMCSCAYFYMVRVQYLKKCKVVENFYIQPNVTQELQYILPLFIGGTKIVWLDKVLYSQIKRDNSIVQSQVNYKLKKYYLDNYLLLARKTLACYVPENNYVHKLLEIGSFGHAEIAFTGCDEYDRKRACYELIDTVNQSGLINKRFDYSDAERFGFRVIYRYISSLPIDYGREQTQIAKNKQYTKRIIGYSAYGKAVTDISDFLFKSDIVPDVFWDMAAKEGDNLKGIPVTRPDFDSLTEHDMVLILLKKYKYADEVSTVLFNTPANENVWHYHDVLDYLMYFR